MTQNVVDLLVTLERRLALRRSFVLFFSVWLTYQSYAWSSAFANESARTGVEVAAIIAAVTAPVSALMAAVLKIYADSKT